MEQSLMGSLWWAGNRIGGLVSDWVTFDKDFPWVHSGSPHFTLFHPVSLHLTPPHSVSLHLTPGYDKWFIADELTGVFVQRIPSYWSVASLGYVRGLHPRLGMPSLICFGLPSSSTSKRIGTVSVCSMPRFWCCPYQVLTMYFPCRLDDVMAFTTSSDDKGECWADARSAPDRTQWLTW